MAETTESNLTLLQRLDKMLEAQNPVTDAMDKLEKKTNVKKRYIALEEFRLPGILAKGKDYLDEHGYSKFLANPRSIYGIGGFIGLWLASGYLAALICNLIGFIYPAYQTVKAIESKDKEDDTEWLMYWVVFATFSVAEFFSDIFLSWFPFYFLGKCIFLMWCMAPIPWNGSRILYHKVIKPFVLRNEMTIDKALDKVTGQAKTLIDQGVKEAQNAAAEAAAEIVKENIKDSAEKKED